MVDMDYRIDNWKKKLLDTGMRNRLINWRETKRSSLRFIKPDFTELWNLIVEKEKTYEFPLPVGELEDEYDNLEVDPEDSKLIIYGKPSKRRTFGESGTNQNVSEMNKTLRLMRNKARLSLEEQGINILFLAFGFLEWYESDSSTEYTRSPLILVPVKIIQTSSVEPFKLAMAEDEIIVNPTLQYKLSNDFGLTLPDYEEGDDINDFMDRILDVVSSLKWNVARSAVIGLFSFLKMNMYEDLDRYRGMITNNKNIKAICGDTSAVQTISDEYIDYDFDSNLKPEDMYSVVDADSSQQEAILCANKGYSFILQGPPGTGKSQTITNIIAEAIGNNKKVLFVSEKKAALDVVYHRLDECGLSDFCFVLHNHKANKKEVLEQLAEGMSLSLNQSEVSSELYEQLDELELDKEKLNEYATELFKPIAPLGKTVYEAYGEIARTEKAPDLQFDIADASTITRKDFQHRIYTLRQYAELWNRNSKLYMNHSWSDTTVERVTNDFMLRMNHELPALRDNFSRLSGLLFNIRKELSLTTRVLSFSDIPLFSDYLHYAADCPSDIPVSWFDVKPETISKVIDSIDENRKLQKEVLNEINVLKRMVSELQSREIVIPFTEYSVFSTYQSVRDDIRHLRRYIKESSLYGSLSKIMDAGNVALVNSELDKILETAREQSSKINSLNKEITAKYESGIFELPVKELIFRFSNEYRNIFKYFKKSYKSDRSIVGMLSRNPARKLSDSDIISVLSKVNELNTVRTDIEKLLARLSDTFGSSLVTDWNTDFDLLNKIKSDYGIIQLYLNNLDYLETLMAKIPKYDSMKSLFGTLYKGLETDWDEVEIKANKAKVLLSDRFIALLGEENQFNKELITDDVKRNIAKASCGIIAREDLSVISAAIDRFNKLFSSETCVAYMPLLDAATFVEKRYSDLSSLDMELNYLKIRSDCLKEDLGPYIDIIEKEMIPAPEIVDIYKKRFYYLWLDDVLPRLPAIDRFVGDNHDKLREEFAKLDRNQFELARVRIKAKLINNLPKNWGMAQTGILKKELSKKRKIMPLRKLFKCIPDLLLSLKPCIMMSPLSVSMFLDADKFQFDTVIFDEASQVCTENAIGAIIRGKQVIIAGDSKQLPPTSFFAATVSDQDYDTDDEEEIDDSNAYESILDEAHLLPEITLLWHYRSRHENLIAFSNAKIYNSKLITFPSNIDNSPGNGVEFIHVPTGFYDRGGRKGNVREAEKVVDIIVDHMHKNPSRSIGVIAFGEIQQTAIETQLRVRCWKDPDLDKYVNRDCEEPFFIKNLENVQGDERDTIIFSIGYAKDVNGVFRMNFGPLNREGGERRLNVAITRAKFNIKVVSSFLPDELDVDKVSSAGPKLLREYMNFARNGISVLDREVTEDDYAVTESPFEESVMNFLINKGYKVVPQVGCSGYRIDLAVRHPKKTIEYVLGIECDGASYHSARTARDRDRLRQDVLERMGWKIYRIWSTDWIKHQAEEKKKLISAIENAISSFGKDSEDEVDNTIDASEFLKVSRVRSYDDNNPLNLTSVNDILHEFGYKMECVPTYSDFDEIVEKLIDELYPISEKVLLRILFGSRALVSQTRDLEDVLWSLKTKITCKHGFYYPKHWLNSKITPYYFENYRRPLKFISLEEIAVLMIKVLRNYHGVTKDALYADTVHALGYKTVRDQTEIILDRAYSILEQQGIIYTNTDEDYDMDNINLVNRNCDSLRDDIEIDISSNRFQK